MWLFFFIKNYLSVVTILLKEPWRSSRKQYSSCHLSKREVGQRPWLPSFRGEVENHFAAHNCRWVSEVWRWSCPEYFPAPFSSSGFALKKWAFNMQMRLLGSLSPRPNVLNGESANMNGTMQSTNLLLKYQVELCEYTHTSLHLLSMVFAYWHCKDVT